MDICLHFFGQVPESRMTGSCGRCTFKFVRSCQTAFQSRCTTLDSHESSGSSVSLQTLGLVSHFNVSHHSECRVLSHCSFNTHFPNNCISVWVFFACILLSCLSSYSYVVRVLCIPSIKVLCQIYVLKFVSPQSVGFSFCFCNNAYKE